MPDNAGDQLRDVLRQQAEAAAAEEVARVQEGLPTDRMQRLERLQKVVEAYDATHPRPPRRRWPVAAVFIGTLLLCSVLLFVRRNETDILLDLSVSELSFVLGAEQKLTELTALTTLAASGMQAIHLPRGRNREAQILESQGGPVPPVRYALAADGRNQSSITLEPVILPANARVRVRVNESQGLHLSMQRAERELQASAIGPVTLAVAGVGVERLDIASPQPLVFRLSPTDAELNFNVAESGGDIFAVPLRTDSLSLIQVDQAGDEARTIVRRTSAIRSGSLYFESLNGLEQKVRPGEMLELAGARGDITALRVESDHLALRFQGRVHGLTVGIGETRRSLMPTWLDWLKTRRSAWLLWGTAVYLFGLVMGFLRWMGKSG